MDSKNIKDYLHLYLGQQCRCYNHADREGWLETISCTIIIEYGDEDSEIEGIVPILRPLSDMTAEEIQHKESILTETENMSVYEQQLAEMFRYMLSRGFDLFGLIDAGLAIKNHNNG